MPTRERIVGWATDLEALSVIAGCTTVFKFFVHSALAFFVSLQPLERDNFTGNALIWIEYVRRY